MGILVFLSNLGMGGSTPIAVSITHAFRNENDTAFWADGINVVALKSSELSGASPSVLGNAAIAGGAGSVTISLSENADVTLIPDHLDASAPTNEQGVTESLTPVVA